MEDTIRIRSALPSDAGGLLDLKLALDRETEFMMLEPGERTETPDAVERRLRGLEPENSIVLVAEREGRLLGYVEADGGMFRRNRHSAYVVIGVRAESAGHGIGSALLAALDRWALERGIHRLELTVMAHNDRAIALYRKSGYRLEGTRRHSVRLGDRYVDELSLAKLL